MEYTTSGEQDTAPEINPSIVMPSGGQFYPASRYTEAIDNESKLRALDRPLGTCEGNQWEPSMEGDMYNSRLLVPDRTNPVDPKKIQELAYPKALLRSGPYDCRANNDAYAIQISSDYMFNNATKQDRYKSMNKPTKPAPPTGSLKAAPESLRPDLLFNAGPPRPIPAAPTVVVSGSAAQNQKPVYVSGSDGGYYYNPSDLAKAMEKNEQQYAAGSGRVDWNAPAPDRNPGRSYERGAANQRADLLANAKSPVMITSAFSDNSPFAAF